MALHTLVKELEHEAQHCKAALSRADISGYKDRNGLFGDCKAVLEKMDSFLVKYKSRPLDGYKDSRGVPTDGKEKLVSYTSALDLLLQRRRIGGLGHTGLGQDYIIEEKTAGRKAANLLSISDDGGTVESERQCDLRKCGILDDDFTGSDAGSQEASASTSMQETRALEDTRSTQSTSSLGHPALVLKGKFNPRYEQNKEQASTRSSCLPEIPSQSQSNVARELVDDTKNQEDLSKNEIARIGIGCDQISHRSSYSKDTNPTVSPYAPVNSSHRQQATALDVSTIDQSRSHECEAVTPGIDRLCNSACSRIGDSEHHVKSIDDSLKQEVDFHLYTEKRTLNSAGFNSHVHGNMDFPISAYLGPSEISTRFDTALTKSLDSSYLGSPEKHPQYLINDREPGSGNQDHRLNNRESTHPSSRPFLAPVAAPSEPVSLKRKASKLSGNHETDGHECNDANRPEKQTVTRWDSITRTVHDSSFNFSRTEVDPFPTSRSMMTEPQSFFTTPFATEPQSTFTASFASASSLSEPPQSVYQMMTLETGSETIQVPIDVHAAARVADEKRWRNNVPTHRISRYPVPTRTANRTTGSARFRQSHREKELAIGELEDKVRELSEENDRLNARLRVAIGRGDFHCN